MTKNFKTANSYINQETKFNCNYDLNDCPYMKALTRNRHHQKPIQWGKNNNVKNKSNDIYFDCQPISQDEELIGINTTNKKIWNEMQNNNDPKYFKAILKELAYTAYSLYKDFKEAYRKLKKEKRMQEIIIPPSIITSITDLLKKPSEMCNGLFQNHKNCEVNYKNTNQLEQFFDVDESSELYNSVNSKDSIKNSFDNSVNSVNIEPVITEMPLRFRIDVGNGKHQIIETEIKIQAVLEASKVQSKKRKRNRTNTEKEFGLSSNIDGYLKHPKKTKPSNDKTEFTPSYLHQPQMEPILESLYSKESSVIPENSGLQIKTLQGLTTMTTSVVTAQNAERMDTFIPSSPIPISSSDATTLFEETNTSRKTDEESSISHNRDYSKTIIEPKPVEESINQEKQIVPQEISQNNVVLDDLKTLLNHITTSDALEMYKAQGRLSVTNQDSRETEISSQNYSDDIIEHAVEPAKCITDGTQTNVSANRTLAHLKRKKKRNQILENLQILSNPRDPRGAVKYQPEEREKILHDISILLNTEIEEQMPQDEKTYLIQKAIVRLTDAAKENKSSTSLKWHDQPGGRPSQKFDNNWITSSLKGVLNPKSTDRKYKIYSKEARNEILRDLYCILLPQSEKKTVEHDCEHGTHDSLDPKFTQETSDSQLRTTEQANQNDFKHLKAIFENPDTSCDFCTRSSEPIESISRSCKANSQCIENIQNLLKQSLEDEIVIKKPLRKKLKRSAASSSEDEDIPGTSTKKLKINGKSNETNSAENDLKNNESIQKPFRKPMIPNQIFIKSVDTDDELKEKKSKFDVNEYKLWSSTKYALYEGDSL